MLATIDKLGYVQIDTLAVVARSHHHILWTREQDYKEENLFELQEKDKKIFEYWSHAVSYLPMKDYRFSIPRKVAFENNQLKWIQKDKNINQYVLDRIKAEGPLQSKNFEHQRTSPANWFEWKPAKRALEQLFMEGKLMIAKRQGFQKVYDLTERVLPDWVDVTTPTAEEYAYYIYRKSIEFTWNSKRTRNNLFKGKFA